MPDATPLTLWQRWKRQPQKVWLRRAVFQLHLWSGIALGLYILVMSVTGSILVYRNELYRATMPDVIVSKETAPRLSDDQLKQAAAQAYPGYRVEQVIRASNPDQAVDVRLTKGDDTKKRLFDPRSGRDLGDVVPTNFWLASKLLELHDNLFAGPAGQKVNGLGGLAMIAVAMTGLVIWWPGVATWRASVKLPRGVGWKRWTWQLHSAVGFWTLAFTIVFGLSGAYLGFPDQFQDVADWFQPATRANAGTRFVDHVIYWLAYLHFGRIDGIGIPCKGPGFCDQATKAVWAGFGLAPAIMFVTGAMMWWNRVVRPRRSRVSNDARREAGVALY